MPKRLNTILCIASVLIAALCILWMGVVLIMLDQPYWTYCVPVEAGLEVCGVPFFTGEGWAWRVFSVFGVPTIIAIAAIRTTRYCHTQRKLNQ